MIFVAGSMNMKPETIDGFVRDVAAMRPKVLTEPGCIHYSLLVEDAATGLVNVLEQWSSYEALVEHLTMPWIVEFFGKHGGNMTASTIQVYDIAGSRPLPSM
jgi:quinol monooxygenase YgiN